MLDFSVEPSLKIPGDLVGRNEYRTCIIQVQWGSRIEIQ